MKFERKVLKIDLYGTELRLQFPTVKQRQEYLDRIRGLDAENDGGKLEDALLDFLSGLGLPKEQALDMYDSDLVEIVNALMPSKKK